MPWHSAVENQSSIIFNWKAVNKTCCVSPRFAVSFYWVTSPRSVLPPKQCTFCPPARVKTSTESLVTSDREPLGPKGTDTLIFYRASSHQGFATLHFELCIRKAKVDNVKLWIRIACVPLRLWKEITTTPTYNVAAIKKNVWEEIMSGYWREPKTISFFHSLIDLRTVGWNVQTLGIMPMNDGWSCSVIWLQI